jgi:hypothetical protein
VQPRHSRRRRHGGKLSASGRHLHSFLTRCHVHGCTNWQWHSMKHLEGELKFDNPITVEGVEDMPLPNDCIGHFVSVQVELVNDLESILHACRFPPCQQNSGQATLSQNSKQLKIGDCQVEPAEKTNL